MPSFNVFPKAPLTRCYICGSLEVVAVCHHCGRAMCQTHRPTSKWLARWLPRFEFRGLNVEPVDAAAGGGHCQDHRHGALSRLWLSVPWLGLGITLLLPVTGAVLILGNRGVLPLLELRQRAVALALILLTTLAPGLLLHILRRSQLKAGRPPLPIVGQGLTIEAEESITGAIELDRNGRHRVRLLEAKGQIDVSLQFDRADFERLDKYRRRFGGLGVLSLTEVQFSAGFLAVRATDLRRPFDYVAGQRSLIELDDLAAGQAFFQGSQTLSDSFWKYQEMYTWVKDPRQSQTLPVQITPVLAQGGVRRAIKLVVEVLPGSPFYENRGNIEQFILCTPDILGRALEVLPESGLTSPTSYADDYQPPPNHQVVVWEQIEVGLEKQWPRQVAFYVQMAGSVSKATEVCGRLRLHFEDAALGISAMKPFSALGEERSPTVNRRYTDVIVDFQLHLAHLPFERETGGPDVSVRLARLPDHRLIAELVHRISDQNVYVKSIVEEPPHADQGDPQVHNHLWEIAGRSHLGTYPIEVNLTVSGREVYRGTAVPSYGETTILLHVQGIALDAWMRNQVFSLKARLLAAIGSLDRQPPASPSTHPPSQPASPTPTPARPRPGRPSGIDYPTQPPLAAEGEEEDL
ncbi:MAG: hypothetical protein AB1791_15475 [Chloroflexota bacterium]